MKSAALFLCIPLCVWSQQAIHTPEQDRNPFAVTDATAVASGKRLYAQVCQGCHGGDGAGSERGPSLANAAAFKHGSRDGEIFLNIRGGIASTQMPPFSRLSSDQAWQLVTYIRSLNGGAAVSPASAPAKGDAVAGQQIFFGSKAACSQCHEVNGRGGVLGPDLSAAGSGAAEALRSKIVNPNAPPNPNVRVRRRDRRGPSVAVVRMKDGTTVRGLRRAEDTFTLHLMDLSGKLQMLPKASIAETRYEIESLMPADYASKLAAGEIDDLVAYLRTLTGRSLDQASLSSEFDSSSGLSFERIRGGQEKEPHNWLSYWGNYQGTHYSPLSQITSANVGRLQARWAAQMPGDTLLEATPLVLDGIMYTPGMPGDVYALDAATGLQIWKFQRKQKVVNPYESNRYNRGVAMLGSRLFTGTLDAALIALDARTGRQLWETQVANTMEGYSITAAPLAIKDKIIVGVAGGEYGIRGFVDAYDPANGKRLWRFYTTPGPGEFGHETWKGDSWKRGGAPTWLTGSYDAETDTLYWATGNPGPDMDGDVRKGDNLFSCSVIALDPATGKRKWHYQFTPNDTHDWDANEDLILADRVWQGQKRKVLMQANRNGFFYVLDATNGKLLLGKPFVKQNWNQGFDENGRPKVVPGTGSSPEGSGPVYPSLGGGTNWQSPSYDPASGWLYLSYMEAGNRYIRQTSEYEAGKQYWGGRGVPLPEVATAGIRAIDTQTGNVQWDFPISMGSLSSGVLATAGNVLFAASNEGNLIALDAKTGRFLWRFQTGGPIASAPMSYAVAGKQYVAVSAGGVLYSFALSE
jgi:PQQ-dependent dehydrogenase (methanol/ethanol family)